MTIISAVAVAASSNASAGQAAVQQFAVKDVPVWAIQDTSVPVVSISLLFEGGSAVDPEGKQGLASMLTDLLLEGSGADDATAFKNKLEADAINFSVSATRDYISVTINTLSENLPQAITLAAQALVSPRFEEEAIQRIRQQHLASIAYQQQMPNRFTAMQWWQKAFPNHPYSFPVSGTAAGVAAVDKASLQQWHQQYFRRGNALIGVAGDIDEKTLLPLLEKLIAGLPAPASPVAASPRQIANAGETIHIPRVVAQSNAYFGQEGIRRDDPRYYAALLLNHVLGGGGFSSRLLEEVREKRGLTYGVSTQLQDLKDGALLLGSVATQPAMMQQSLDVIRMVWQDIAENGITAAELQDAKEYQNGSFPLRLDSTRDLAWVLASMQYQNLPATYLIEREALINAVTLEEVNSLAKELLHPNKIFFVVVGPEN